MRISRFLLGSSIAASILAACNSDLPMASSTFSAEVEAGATTGSTGEVTGTVSAPKSYKVGGTVRGLAGQGLVLDINGVQVQVRSNGSFTAPPSFPTGTAYAITVQSQPSAPNQLCVLGGESGTVGTTDVSTVTVECSNDHYIVGGEATGIIGTGVVVQLNGGDDVQVTANGKFAFPATYQTGALYAVTVKTRPQSPSQTCTVANGLGKVTDANVANLRLTCVIDGYRVRGTVTGLDGTGLVLQNSGGDDLPVSANGAFAFSTPVQSGAAYAVTVKTQPSGRTQNCVVGGEQGSIGNSDVATVTINCATSSFTVGGTASGIAGTVKLLLNGANEASVTGNGAFAFPTSLLSGTTYTATIKEKPQSPSQTCAITQPDTVVGGSAVTSIGLDCTTDAFTVGGTITGLVGTLVLQNGAGNELTLSTNDPWTFATAVTSGTLYGVTVKQQPVNQTCTVAAGADTMGNASYTGASVSCVSRFTVGGTVTGLAAGDSIVLHNGSDDVTLGADGSFTFPSSVQVGSTYAVTVKTAPATNSSCIVNNGSGTMGSATVSNVTVSCVAPIQPNVCDMGNDASGSGYVVCAADATTAWISYTGVGGNTFHPHDVCISLGYARASKYGGNCGSICGYCDGAHSCSSNGARTFDNGTNVPTTFGGSRTWECAH